MIMPIQSPISVQTMEYDLKATDDFKLMLTVWLLDYFALYFTAISYFLCESIHICSYVYAWTVYN